MCPLLNNLKKEHQYLLCGKEGMVWEYSNNFKNVDETVLVHWDGDFLFNGKIGGGKNHHVWIESDASYNALVASTMSFSQWR